MNVEMLISFVFAVAALAISPGPDNIFVLIYSIRFGRKPAFIVIIGLMLGCLVHTSLVALGVSWFVQNNKVLFTLLKIFGACYLLYLAYKVYTSSEIINFHAEGIEAKPALKLLQKGFMMNVLNPKVSLFFLALFPGFLFSETLSQTTQFFALGCLFIVVSFVVFAILAFLAGSLKKYLEQHTNSGKFLKWLQILVFVGIAAFILI